MNDITYSEELLSGGVRHVALAGTLDTNATMKQGEELHAFVTQAGGTVLVDLEGVEYMSSSGIGILVQSAKTLEANGGSIVLARPQPRVADIIAIVTGFLPNLPVYPTVEDALDALGD